MLTHYSTESGASCTTSVRTYVTFFTKHQQQQQQAARALALKNAVGWWKYVGTTTREPLRNHANTRSSSAFDNIAEAMI
jgi:hypothetical protein